MSKLSINRRVLVGLVVMLFAITQSAIGLTTQPFAPAADTGSVELNSFYVYNWSWINSPYSCRDPNTGCWVYLNYKAPGWALSQQKATIDAKWKNPTLIFWTKYSASRMVNFAYVEIQVAGDTRWDRVKVLGGTMDVWHQVTVDLKAYSGKSITVKFFAQPSMYSVTRNERKGYNYYTKEIFYVQGVSISPEPPTP